MNWRTLIEIVLVAVALASWAACWTMYRAILEQADEIQWLRSKDERN